MCFVKEDIPWYFAAYNIRHSQLLVPSYKHEPALSHALLLFTLPTQFSAYTVQQKKKKERQKKTPRNERKKKLSCPLDAFPKAIFPIPCRLYKPSDPREPRARGESRLLFLFGYKFTLFILHHIFIFFVLLSNILHACFPHIS